MLPRRQLLPGASTARTGPSGELVRARSEPDMIEGAPSNIFVADQCGYVVRVSNAGKR